MFPGTNMVLAAHSMGTCLQAGGSRDRSVAWSHTVNSLKAVEFPVLSGQVLAVWIAWMSVPQSHDFIPASDTGSAATRKGRLLKRPLRVLPDLLERTANHARG